MKRPIGKGTEEYMMFADFYKLCESFGTPEESDEYWQVMIQVVDKFTKQYNTPLGRHLGIALMMAKEEELKQSRKVARG